MERERKRERLEQQRAAKEREQPKVSLQLLRRPLEHAILLAEEARRVLERVAQPQPARAGRGLRGGPEAAGVFGGPRGLAVERVEAIEAEIKDSPFNMAQAALKFVLAHPAVASVIAGIRNEDQASMNVEVSEMADMSGKLIEKSGFCTPNTTVIFTDFVIWTEKRTYTVLRSAPRIISIRD